MGAQYAIMRFAKYKGGAMGGIEAHNERKKEKYESNPDVDINRSDQNFHLIEPQLNYRQESERQIKAANCRVRSDSVRMVEALFTASPEFFENKSREEIQDFFKEALDFFTQNQRKDTIISAVVHMDERTPHMHLVFVPLTEDNRLCAKEIIGNRKHLTEWQDKYWKHMVARYPDLERGESASKTGRTHIPPRVYKEIYHLQQEQEEIISSIEKVNHFNAKKQSTEVINMVNNFIPKAERMKTELEKYRKEYEKMKEEYARMESQQREISSEKRENFFRALHAEAEVSHLQKMLERIPPEIVKMYQPQKSMERER